MIDINITSHNFSAKGKYLGITYNDKQQMSIVYISTTGAVEVVKVDGIYSFNFPHGWQVDE